jgi:hypothetical protein
MKGETMGTRIYLIGLAMVAGLFYFLYNSLYFWLRGFFIFLIVLLALTLLIGVIFLILYLREKIKSLQVIRLQNELSFKKSRYDTVQDGFGMLHLINYETDVIENLSAFPGSHHNGHWEEPHPAASTAWYALVGKRGVESPTTHLLPAKVIENENLDLLNVFTQATQAYAIIGGQQTGKTFQARHIANYWLEKGIKPVVIGPKWDRGEWEGCILIGGESNYSEVAKGIEKVKKLAHSRHSDNSKSHKEHSIQPIFFDDWTVVIDNVNTARNLIIEATTLYASVNIVLYFIIHSDTANAWGVDKKGAALKDNFIKLFIVPQYDTNGKVIREQTKGYIQFAGESVDRPVKLFDTPTQSIGKAIELKLPNPLTDEERKIIEAYKQTGSVTGVVKKVYGKKGGFQSRRVREILIEKSLMENPL